MNGFDLAMFFMFIASGGCNSLRSVDLGDGMTWELAHNGTQAHKATSAQRAYKRQRCKFRFLFQSICLICVICERELSLIVDNC